MDFSKQLRKAEEALQRKSYDFAVELYQQLLEIDPDQGEARRGLRVALKRRAEQRKGGSRWLRTLSGAVPLATAKALHKAGRNDACAKALETYLATNPLDEDANLLLGMALESAGHLNSAREVFGFLAEIAPQNPEGLKRAGAMAQRAGDHAQALELYERALKVDPRDQEALKARKDLAAESALSKGRYEAVHHSREQIRDKAEAVELERSKRRFHSEEELRTDLETLGARLVASPSNPDVLLEMADIHEKLRDPEAALDFAQRALEYRRDSADLAARVSELKGKVLKRRIAQADKGGDRALAGRLENELLEAEVGDYRQRVRLHPGDASMRLQLGKRLVRAGCLDEALGELQKARADPRVEREALFHLAQCFQAKGFPDLARKEYERALEGLPRIDDQAKEILYNLGAIAEGQGDAAGARSFYVRVFEVDIGYRDVAAKMERLK